MGRNTLLANQIRSERKNPLHIRAAVLGHFRGAQRLSGDKLEGSISIFWLKHTGVLAGDVYGRSPLGWSLRVFKVVYALGSLARWRVALQARRQRSVNI